MSILTDPATCDILSCELESCPRAAAVLGALAAQWQQIVVSLQRVEQEAVSSQCLAKAIENMNRTRAESTGDGLRLKDGERLSPEELVRKHTARRIRT